MDVLLQLIINTLWDGLVKYILALHNYLIDLWWHEWLKDIFFMKLIYLCICFVHTAYECALFYQVWMPIESAYLRVVGGPETDMEQAAGGRGIEKASAWPLEYLLL